MALSKRRMLALGRARAVELWHANVLHPEWSKLAGILANVRPAAKASRKKSQ
jgi:hypothetical protein